MYKRLPYPIVLLVFLVCSCEQPLDSVIESVNEANTILRKYDWQLAQFRVVVKNDDIPPPLLFDSSDSLIRKGIYDLDDMVLDASDMREYRVNFTPEGDVITSGGLLDLLAESESNTRYFVINDRSVRITNPATKLIYNYFYDEQAQTISLAVSESSAERLIRKINDKLIDNVAKRTPGKIGDVIAGLLFNNEGLQRLINDVLVSAISGQLSFINEFDPEEAARLLAQEIMNALEQVDWEGKLTELLQAELEKLTDIDPEEVSEKMGEEIAQFINDQITAERIYNLILPYIQEIPTNSEAISEAIATLVVNLFLEVFDEEALQSVVTVVWEQFTELDEEQIELLADTLTSFVQDIWLNQDNLAGIVLPFTQQIDDTPLLQLGALATETTESIRALVDQINEKFPDLNLSPNYDNLQNAIRLFYVGVKPIIAVQGPEQAAADLANLVLTQFLNRDNIQGAFTAALQFLQTIDPELAGNALTEWLLSLELEIAPPLISFLRDRLSPILDNLNPELTALTIAEALNDFIAANVTPESMKGLLLPILEDFTNINAEAVANYLAQQILALDILKDNINEENIRAALLPVLQSIQQTNVEELSQNLIQAIVDSGIFEEVITEDRVSLIISLLIYKASWDNVLIANNFEEATILLNHD